MSFRIRIGPIGIGSGGRVSGSLGPVSVSGGGRRRGGGCSGAGALVFVAAFVIALALKGCHHDDHRAPLSAAQRARAITQAQYESARKGQKRVSVLRRLGAPESRDHLRAAPRLWEEIRHLRHCVYYNMADGSFGDVYELCFAAASPHRLNARHRYFDGDD